MARAGNHSGGVAARGLASKGVVRGGSMCGQAASLLVLALTRRGLGAPQLVSEPHTGDRAGCSAELSSKHCVSVCYRLHASPHAPQDNQATK